MAFFILVCGVYKYRYREEEETSSKQFERKAAGSHRNSQRTSQRGSQRKGNI